MADSYDKIRKEIANYKKVYGTDPPQEIRDKWAKEIQQTHKSDTVKAKMEEILNTGKQILGGGLMIGSAAIPVSHSPGVTGAVGGGIYGAGDAIANNKPFMKTVAADAAIGGALGVGAGKIAPALVKGGKSVAGKVANAVEKSVPKSSPPAQQVAQKAQIVNQKVNQTLNKPLNIPTLTKKTSTPTPKVAQKAIQQEPNYSMESVDEFLKNQQEVTQPIEVQAVDPAAELLNKLGITKKDMPNAITNYGEKWFDNLPMELKQRIANDYSKRHIQGNEAEWLRRLTNRMGYKKSNLVDLLDEENKALVNAILEREGVYPNTPMKELRTHVSPISDISDFETGHITRDRLGVGDQGTGYFANADTDLSGLNYVKSKYYVQQPKEEFFLNQDLPWEEQSEIVKTLADKLNYNYGGETMGEYYHSLSPYQKKIFNEYLNSQGVAGHTGTHPSWYASGHNEPFKEFVPFEGRTKILGNEILQKGEI